MRRTGRCPSCASDVIYRVDAVGDAGDWVGDGDGPLAKREGTHATARRILMTQSTHRGLLGGEVQRFAPAGETEAYVCAACGRVEEHLKRPDTIDWTTVVGARRWAPPGR